MNCRELMSAALAAVATLPLSLLLPRPTLAGMLSKSSDAQKLALASAALVFWLGACISPAEAQAGGEKTADGLTVYVGVLPAAMIQGHPKEHPEPTMHGGVPRGRDAFHVIAAVFDAASGERVENARVQAQVSPLGLAGATRTLEAMQIAGTVTYGNYFTIRPNEPYRILLSISRAGEAKIVNLEFSHEHRTR